MISSDYAALSWTEHSKLANKGLEDLPLIEYGFVTNRKCHAFWMQRTKSLFSYSASINRVPGKCSDYFVALLMKAESPYIVSPLLSACYFGLIRVIMSLVQLPRRSHLLTNVRRAIHVAAERGHASIIALLLQHKLVDPDSRTGLNISPLHRAAYMGHSFVVSLLLATGKVDLNVANAMGNTPLLFAINYEHEKLAIFLLSIETIDTAKQGSSYPNTPKTDALALASARGLAQVVQCLLRKENISINSRDSIGRTPLMHAVLNNHSLVVKLLTAMPSLDPNVRDMNGYTALHYASQKGYSESIKELLKHDQLDVNARDRYGYTALLNALEQRHHESLEILIKDLNIDINCEDFRGNSPLIISAEKNFTQDARLLLESGRANLNAKNVYGTTALHWAINTGNNALLDLLLNVDNSNVDVNAENSKGSTPLMLAASWGNVRALKSLLGNPNLKINLTDSKGLSALNWALTRNREECIALLRIHNAQEYMDTTVSEINSSIFSPLLRGRDMDIRTKNDRILAD